MKWRYLAAAIAAITVVAACEGGRDDVARETPQPTVRDMMTATPTATPTGEHPPTVTPRVTPTEMSTPAPSPSETGDATEWASCEHPEGIAVDYPVDWHVNDGDVLPKCSAFDRQPLDVPENQEFFDAAVMLRVEPVGFSRIADPEHGSGEVLDRSAEMVDGHDAVRVETRASGDGLLPDDLRSTRWFVVAGREKTLVAVTYDVQGRHYSRNRDVLDRMVRRLQIPLNE